MTEEITYEISCNARGSVLLLELSSGVLQTTIGSALFMNHFSRLTNCHYIKLTYLYTIKVYPYVSRTADDILKPLRRLFKGGFEINPKKHQELIASS